MLLFFYAFHAKGISFVPEVGVKYYDFTPKVSGSDIGVKITNFNLWMEFQIRITESDFWRLPTEDDRICLDGYDDVIEGKKNGKYHCVSRHCPTSNVYYELIDSGEWIPHKYGFYKDEEFVKMRNFFYFISNNFFSGIFLSRDELNDK